MTIDGLARALTIAWVYEHPTKGLESLIRESPRAAMPGDADLPGAAQEKDSVSSLGDDIALWVPWLEAQARRDGGWSREELAALELMAVLLGRGLWSLPAVEAHRRWERLRVAIDHFGVERVPRRAEVADRCEDLGDALDPDVDIPSPHGTESVEAYEMAIRLGRSNGDLMHKLGLGLEMRLGRYEEAEAAYRKAMELDPKMAFPHNALCLLYQFDLGRWREAGEAIERAIRLEPDIAAIRETQGLYLEESGDFDGAERAYREGLRCQPGDLYNTVGIGWVALQSGDDITAARDALATLSATDRIRPEATFLEAGLVVCEGRWAEAQPLLARWIRAVPATLSAYPWTQRSRWCALMRRSGVPIPWADCHPSSPA